MKFVKKLVVAICLALIFFGIVYNVVALPFSSPEFDLIAGIGIGVAFLIAIIIGRGKK